MQQKRVEKKVWSKPGPSNFQGKSFPIQEWNKYYSSIGTKRAPIAINEKKEKQVYKTDLIKRKEFATEMSRWNKDLADLHKKAGISMDDRAKIAADHKLYQMMLQDSQVYSELRKEVSLRDLNRFQFRRNRSDGELPIKKAGSDE
ncbi:MAG: hypothetical protein AAF065_06720 [Verrucomicrobiota bacterium]